MPLVQHTVSYWTPLLTGAEALPARACLNDITSALESALENNFKAAAATARKFPTPYHLGEGAAGIAVFFAYMEAAGVHPRARELASAYLNIAIESLTSQAMAPGLFSGFTGVAWAIQHAATVLGEPADDLSEIDSAIETYVGKSPWQDDYDLISGLVGLGVYCLERLESETARQPLTLVITRLEELAIHSDEGVCWFTSPEMLPQYQQDRYPQGYYNLGVAHGIPGVIAFLARVYAAGIERQRVMPLLDGAVRWLLRQRLPSGKSSNFTSFFDSTDPGEDCRLAWCYGDAGIAAALLLAARCVGNAAWEKEALELAGHAARRSPESCGVQDVCFCHGAAGLAHIFNRLYQATHEEQFALASRYWLGRTLQFQKPGTGVAGFSVVTADENLEIVVAGRHGLIEGVGGVGLVLLSLLTSIEPCWDRIFLTDIPLQPISQ